MFPVTESGMLIGESYGGSGGSYYGFGYSSAPATRGHWESGGEAPSRQRLGFGGKAPSRRKEGRLVAEALVLGERFLHFFNKNNAFFGYFGHVVILKQ